MIEPDYDLIEAIARICYAHTFTARQSRDTWETLNQSANQGGQYANVIQERCYQQARDIEQLIANRKPQR